MSKKVMAFVIVAVSVVMSATFSPSSDGKEQRGKRLIPDAWIDGDPIGDSHRVDDDIKVKAKIQRYDSEVAASHAYEAYVLCYDGSAPTSGDLDSNAKKMILDSGVSGDLYKLWITSADIEVYPGTDPNGKSNTLAIWAKYKYTIPGDEIEIREALVRKTYTFTAKPTNLGGLRNQFRQVYVPSPERSRRLLPFLHRR